MQYCHDAVVIALAIAGVVHHAKFVANFVRHRDGHLIHAAGRAYYATRILRRTYHMSSGHAHNIITELRISVDTRQTV